MYVFFVLSVATFCSGITVLITGASSGIGEITARSLAKDGLNVVLVARRKEKLSTVVSEICSIGGKAHGVVADVGDEAQMKNAFQEAIDIYGEVNFVVANAGIPGALFNDFIGDESAISNTEIMFKTNFLGVLITFKYGVKALRKSGGGVMVAVSSVAGSLSRESSSEVNYYSWSYSPSKSAVDQIVRSSASLSKENIRVYSVGPHAFQSESLEQVAHSIGKSTEFLAYRSNPIYPGKIGNPEDLVKVFRSLFDNSTYYLPGDLIYCDNDVTYHADIRYRYLYRGWNNFKVSPEHQRDFQGKPIVQENLNCIASNK